MNGGSVSGQASVVINEHGAAVASFNSGAYKASLIHSQKAIAAYEETQSKMDSFVGAIFVSDSITSEISKIYRLAGAAAQSLRQTDIAEQYLNTAYRYAKQSVTEDSSAANYAELAINAFNVGKQQEAREYIEKALQDEPTNATFLDFKEVILASNSQ